jgi:hypothetical protein
MKERLDPSRNFFSTCPSAEKFIKNIAFMRKKSPEAGAEGGGRQIRISMEARTWILKIY